MTPQQARRNRLILIGVTLALLLVTLWQAGAALSPFIFGSVVAYLLLPPVRRLERLIPAHGRWQGLRRPLAIVVVYLGVILLVISTVNLVVPALVRQIGELAERTPLLIEQARRQGNIWLERYHELVPDEIESAIDANVSQVGVSVANSLRTLAGSTLGWLLRTVNVLLGLLVIPLWLFYVLKDEQAGIRFFYTLFPPAVRGDVRAIGTIINTVLGRYLRSQLLLGLCIGVASFIGLSLIGVPYALVLALINGIFELIPIIGPILGAIPAIIVTLALAPDKVLVVIAFYLILQQIENIVLVPKIQGDAVELNPAIIIMGLVIAGQIGGVWGLLAVVPLLGIARDVFVYLYRRFEPVERARDRLSSGSDDETPAMVEPDPAPLARVDPPSGR